jgi:exodeoxyribonuclease V alpha subunit
MVTIELFYSLIKAFPHVEKITLVGDINQLSPIGWGALLAQMVKSKTIPTYRLTINHRVYQISGEKDGIILNANAIISHDPDYPFEFVRTTNFSLMEGNINRVFDVVKTFHQANLNIADIVVLTPYNLNLDKLNKTVQGIYNSNLSFTKPGDLRAVTDSRGNTWAVGDKVMLNENDKEIGVFNGEEGIITKVNDKQITVNFGLIAGVHDFLLEPINPEAPNRGFRSIHDKEDSFGDSFSKNGNEKERTVKKLNLSYALTIDKSQGSEWDYTILYIPPEAGDNSFLNKNRIYTAITRTKKGCWVISNENLLNKLAVRFPAFRCDNLHKRLSANLPHMELFRIPPVNNVLAEMENQLHEKADLTPDFGYDSSDD